MSEIDELYERLKKVNEPKGYLLNQNEQLTTGLLKGLLFNRERYGYMCCP
jgi:ferredoxin-thioredoxin reductase catalytic chain